MTTLRAVWEQKPEVPWLKKNERKEIGDGANTQLFQGALQQRQEKIRWQLVGGAGEGGEGQRRLWWWRSKGEHCRTDGLEWVEGMGVPEWQVWPLLGA